MAVTKIVLVVIFIFRRGYLVILKAFRGWGVLVLFLKSSGKLLNFLSCVLLTFSWRESLGGPEIFFSEADVEFIVH